jgi:hypothetical protein
MMQVIQEAFDNPFAFFNLHLWNEQKPKVLQ